MTGRIAFMISSLVLAASAAVAAGATSGPGSSPQPVTLAMNAPALGQSGARRPEDLGLAVAPADRGIAADVARGRDVRDFGHTAAATPIQIGLLMRVRNQAQLEQLTLLQGERRSPFYHHYLSPAEFTAAFAPDATTYARTLTTLERRGFRILQTFPNRSFIRAQASSSTIERYFATELHSVFQTGHGVRYENVRPALMPAELRADVVSVSGLHSIVTMHHPIQFANRSIIRRSAYYSRALATIARMHGETARRRTEPSPRRPDNVPTPLETDTPGPNPSPDASIAPGTPASEYVASIGGYGPDIYVNAYDYPVQHGYGGRHHAAGSVIEADFSNADANLEFTNFGIPRTGNAYRVCPDPNGGPTCYNTIGQGDPEGESTLDALTIMSMAPAVDFYEYLAPQFDDLAIETAYEYIVNQDVVDAVNSSFGGCETDDPSFGYATNYIAMEGAALGISFEASTGDTGAGECGVYITNGAPATEFNTSLPSSDPYFTAVGGTDFYQLLTCTGVGSDCYTDQTAWTFGGGGYSVFNPVPSWQAPLLAGQAITSVGSQTQRNTPDIAFTADELPPGVGIAIYYNGTDEAIGGTSVASPMWTALQVEINQIQKSRNGFVNPGLYAVAGNATTYAYAFRDIVGGTNERYTAIPGYDDSSGLGTPLGWELASVENGTPGATAAPSTTPSPVPSVGASPAPTPTPSPTPVSTFTPHPSGTNFAVSTIAGSSTCAMSMNGSGTGACFDNPTGIVYVASSALGVDTQSTTDNYLFVDDFTTGFLRGMDLATSAVVTEEDRQWSNAARVPKMDPQSLLYGLAYLGPASPDVETFGGLYVVSGGDDSFSRIALPTSPDPAATPDGDLKALTGASAAAVFDTPGTDAGVVDSKDGTLHLGVFAGAIDDDVSASTGLPATGNFGITTDGALNFVITDSGANSIVKATDLPSSTVSAFVSGAPLNAPKEITYVSSLSAYFVANCGGNNIIRVSSAGAMTIAAGDGAPRELNGNNTGAEFNCPFGITTDGTNLYVTDLSGNTIRKISNLI